MLDHKFGVCSHFNFSIAHIALTEALFKSMDFSLKYFRLDFVQISDHYKLVQTHVSVILFKSMLYLHNIHLSVDLRRLTIF